MWACVLSSRRNSCVAVFILKVYTHIKVTGQLSFATICDELLDHPDVQYWFNRRNHKVR